MKRFISTSALSAVLLALLLALGACSTGYAEEEFTLQPGEAFSSAVADMREAREAASVLGAFTNDSPIYPQQDYVQSPQAYVQQIFAPLMHLAPVDLDGVPTRSQLTLILNNLIVDGQPVNEAISIRPGLDITVYADNDFYYMEGGVSLAGLPFPVVNIGIDGMEVSMQVPLLYERYFTVDVASIIEEMMEDGYYNYSDFYLPMQSMGFGGYFARQMEMQNAFAEAFTNAIDIEGLFLEVLEELLAATTGNGNEYNLVIPAQDANAAFEAILDSLFAILETVDLSAFNGDIQEEWLYELPRLREEMEEIKVSRDMTIAYILESDVLMSIETELYMTDSSGDEIRFLLAYANNSGDHVGDISWVFEMEDMHPRWPVTIRVEYTSTLDTTSGYARRDGITVNIIDNWDDITLAFGWYLTRTEDSRFYAGLEFDIDDAFETVGIHLFAQGAKAYGDDFFTVDIDRLGLRVESFVVDYEIVLGAFFRHETIDAAAVPTIAPANQFFVMDASEEELESIMQQIESNIDTVTRLFSFLGI